MNRANIAGFTLLALVGLILITSLNNKEQGQIHNLISLEKAEAFTLFEQWIIKNSRKYREQQEKSYRFGKFFENYKFVKDHNNRFSKGEQTYEVQLNKFADIDQFQFKALYTGLLKKDKQTITNKCTGQIKVVDPLPETVDWVGKAVSVVKNQGGCGSCWAFSACGALEGLIAIGNHTVYNLSVQQLVDCSTKQQYGNQGCNGGYMDAAFWYVIDHGITTDQKYRYVARGQKCLYKNTTKVYQNTRCAEVPANKTKALASAVVAQPVSVSVEADALGFQFYSKGVFSGKCGTELNHGIVLVGYGNLSGKDYWKCKNSWGNDWGMQGYILLAKSDQDGPGQCGVLMQNAVPLP